MEQSGYVGCGTNEKVVCASIWGDLQVSKEHGVIDS